MDAGGIQQWRIPKSDRRDANIRDPHGRLSPDGSMTNAMNNPGHSC
jgi:hypothetical protein